MENNCSDCYCLVLDGMKYPVQYAAGSRDAGSEAFTLLQCQVSVPGPRGAEDRINDFNLACVLSK